MKRDHQQPNRGDHALRQVDQRGKDDHRHADDPDHLKKTEKSNVRIEEDAELHDRQLEKDQPEPARHQKPRQLRFALSAGKLQVRTRARQKHEHRCAEVCDPAREEEGDVRARQIGRIKL